MVGWARAAVAGAAVDLAQTADTDGLAEVDVAGDGGGAHVEPVDGLGGELLGGTGLDGVDPTWERGLVLWRMSGELDLGVGREGLVIPGIGSFPCLFKKAAYASMNFCA